MATNVDKERYYGKPAMERRAAPDSLRYAPERLLEVAEVLRADALRCGSCG